MNILSINHGIGPSVCLLKDGKVLFAIEEERLNREKNTMGFPKLALQLVSKEHSKFIKSVNIVAVANHQFIEDNKTKFRQKYYDNFYGKSFQEKLLDFAWVIKKKINFLPKRKENNNEQIAVKSLTLKFCKNLRKNINFNFFKHHDCHAAAAYYGLARNFDKPYLVLTLDGGGDGENATVQIGQFGKLKRLSSTPSGNSIGNLYSITTFLLGLTPHEHEYKLMGLSAYVPQIFKKKFSKIFSKYLNIDENNNLNFKATKNIKTNKIHKLLFKDFELERFDNIAGGLQFFTEELVTKWIKNCIKQTGIKDILLSGGVFMNVAMNKKISEMSEVNTVDVFPSCGDETNSFGAAFLLNGMLAKKLPSFDSFMLGSTTSINKKTITKYKHKCLFLKVKNTDLAAAKLLAKGKIIGKCDGPMEFGARALGNRSVLADPKILDSVEKINASIKQRDFWMPFAPAILIEEAEKYVKIPKSLKFKKNPSPYMMFVMDSKKNKQSDMIAALHKFDKSARVEIVDKVYAPKLYSTISYFKKLTKRACLLNTSFNIHGFPIVRTAEEAIKVLLDSSLDALVVEGYIITKRKEK